MKPEKKVTQRQKNSVHFCEGILNIQFMGDIENSRMVSRFLFTYLDAAKKKADSNRANISRRPRNKSMKSFYETYGSILEKKKNRRG